MTRTSLWTAIAAGLIAAGTAAAEPVAPDAVVFEDGAVAASLTGVAGDPAAGRKVFIDRKLGNCVACHVNPDTADQSFPGETGPSLEGAGSRWTEAQLRGILVNAKNMFDGTLMPAFYRTSGLNRVASSFEGGTILSAQQVEDVVAYIATLKD